LVRFIAADPELNFVGNLLRDLALNSQQVSRFAIIIAWPTGAF